MKKLESTSQTSIEANFASSVVALMPAQYAWRQGSVLPTAAHFHLSQKIGSDDFVMVISHDCDCVRSVEDEPFIDYVIGSFVEKVEGNLTKAKSTRRLHLHIVSSNKKIELNSTRKGFIPKKQLLEFQPREDMVLSNAEKKMLSRWLALRYERPALPNELVRRLKKRKASEIFSSSCKTLGLEIQGIYIDFDPLGELPLDEIEPYSLSIKVVWDSEIEGAEDSAIDVASKIRSKFVDTYHKPDGGRQEWLGIELDHCDAVSDLDSTLRDVRKYLAWQNDDVSLGDGSDLPIR